jgi:medium-chain acyl-[acyl-carrier-protein] hydrolase
MWFNKNVSRGGAILRLFCFPYAGGSEIAFSNWPKALPPQIQVCPVLLPGRGSRINEPAYANLTDLISDLAGAMENYFDLPFVFFGHSMGAMLSHELSVKLRQDYGLIPEHLFVSGRGAPQSKRPVTSKRPESMCQLSDEDFIRELKNFEGTPEEIFNDRELLSLFLPIIKSDFQLAEAYVYKHQQPLDCSITAFGGMGELDEVSIDNLNAWSDQTTNHFDKYLFEGGHFFIKSAESKILDIIVHKCKNIIFKMESAIY